MGVYTGLATCWLWCSDGNWFSLTLARLARLSACRFWESNGDWLGVTAARLAWNRSQHLSFAEEGGRGDIPGFPHVGSGTGMAMALTAAAKTMTERHFMIIEVVDCGSVG